jgi:cytochrome c556
MTGKLKGMIQLATAFALVMPTIALADESENIIKYRQGVMKAIGGHMSATSLIVRGKVSYKDDLKNHVLALKTLTSDIPGLFPEDSDFGETRAKEEVWGKRDEFVKAADTSKQSIIDLMSAVESGKPDAITANFKQVGEGCKGCHKDFREKDD